MKAAINPCFYKHISPYSNWYLEGGKNVIISPEIPLNKNVLGRPGMGLIGLIGSMGPISLMSPVA
jgi:hypothetical protein